jgi:hypothetical protein
MTRPLQVYLEADDLARLEAFARQRRWTKSEVVRAALRVFTRARDTDPLLAASGMIDGLPADGSGRFDDYLQETYVAERAAPYGRRRRASAPRVRR